MTDPQHGGPKKGGARVQVHHFPKGASRKGPPPSARDYTSTIPEFRLSYLEDDPVTEPGSLEADVKTDPAIQLPDAGDPKDLGTAHLEIDTDPALQYHKAKVKELLSSRRVREKGRLSRTQIAELSLFGHSLFERGRLEDARVVFEGLVGMGVEDAFPHTMLGTIFLALGDSGRALALFEAALAIDRKDIAARVYRGEIRLHRGKTKQAIEDLKRALALGVADDPFVLRARRLLELAKARSKKKLR